MDRLTTEQVQEGFRLLGLETEQSRAEFTRFAPPPPLRISRSSSGWTSLPNNPGPPNMPSWHRLLHEIKYAGSTYDVVRRRYLKKLHKVTKRNIIVYYSGWLQKPGLKGLAVNDADKNGLMTVIHKLDRKKGLDLVLHTPGGETAATESIVDYLHTMFDGDIRAIVPQLAMSAGTMISCACKEIIMGKQSNLGPIDPQFGPLPAHGIVEEFKRALAEIKADLSCIPVWQPIIAKYHPTLIGECEKAIQWSNEMTKEWLLRGMLRGEPDADTKADQIITELGDHALTKSHARHLSAAKCKSMGLKIRMMEEDQALQDAILTVHHACIHTLSAAGAYKIIENHRGVAYMQVAQAVLVQAPGSEQRQLVIEPPKPKDEEEPAKMEQIR